MAQRLPGCDNREQRGPEPRRKAFLEGVRPDPGHEKVETIWVAAEEEWRREDRKEESPSGRQQEENEVQSSWTAMGWEKTEE